MLYNTACLCEYIGTAYSGWQRQPNGTSIQGIIENVLSNVFNEQIKIAGSGRTDAGVHALGLVFSFKSIAYREPYAVTKALNCLLPKDIAVLNTVRAPDNFHAGKSAVSKTYVYKIINRPVPSAIYNDRALWIRTPIDVARLNEFLAFLVGKHDFASFCVKKTKKENSVRTVNFARANKDGDIIEIEINASGFLHNMVRIITGTCVSLTTKGENPDKIKEILSACDRRKAGVTAPPYGLYQKAIFYGTDGIPGLSGINSA